MIDVALTFDDGYREQLRIARFLANRGIKATFFVIAGLREYMGKELLRPEEIREVARLGHEIGSHTMTHIDMTKTPRDVMLRELIESKKILSDLLGEEVVSFAYPYGLHSTEAAELARQVYRVVRTMYLGNGRNYVLFDEHGCVNAFNLKLQNLYEIIQLRRQEILVLFTHLPSITKLSILLTALKPLKPRFLTISEVINP